MKNRRKKRAGSSLALPFEEFLSVALPPSSAPRERKSRPSEPEPDVFHPQQESSSEDWGQLTLWVEATPPDSKRQSPRESPQVSISQENPLSPPSESKSSPGKPKGTSEDPAPPPTISRPKSPERSAGLAQPEGKKGIRAAPVALDESGIEAAAEALGLDLEELRGQAREMELSPFRSYLRAQAVRQLRMLRETPGKDLFEWEGAALASVPAFVENRSLVETLYRSLRGEDEAGSLFNFE